MPVCAFTNPPACTNVTDLSVAFTCTDDVGVVSVLCSLDNAAPAPCASQDQFVVAGISEGTHKIGVHARDAAGNVGQVTHDVGVDRSPAMLQVTPSASLVSTNTFSVSFAVAAAGACGIAERVECSLDNGSFSVCTSPHSFSGLAAGVHSACVRATDGAGNARSVCVDVTVDLAAPVIDIGNIGTFTPTSYSATVNVPYSFTCTDDASGCEPTSLRCAVDGISITPCDPAGSFNVGGTGVAGFGLHLFEVAAMDRAGHMQSASRAFSVVRCAREFQYPQRTSGGFTRGDCCSGLVASDWYDVMNAFWHRRGDGSCRPQSDYEAGLYECIWGGGGCAQGETTATWFGASTGCSSLAGRTTCVASLADAQTLCGMGTPVTSATPFHGRANEGWHPGPSAGCVSGVMSSSDFMRRSCSDNTCFYSVDEGPARSSVSSAMPCQAGLNRHCRENPVDPAVACVCSTTTASPYEPDGRN